MSAKMVVEVPATMAKLAEAMTSVVKLVEAQVERGVASGPSAYDEFERALTEAVASLERAAHEPALGALDIDAPAVKIDGRTYRRALRSPGDYHTRSGSVSVPRTLYREAGNRKAPSVDLISMRAGVVADGWLPGTARQVAHMLQQGTSREAETTAGQLRVLPYSRSSFERVGHAVGRRYVERAPVIERELIDDEDVPDDARAISVSIDRVSIPMEEPRERPLGRPRRGAPKNPITRAYRMGYVGTITYLENNAGRMDYARARKLGLPIGSGNVEATCKSLVNLRMNRSGSRWKVDTGEHVLRLRALALSDRWDAAMDLTLAPPRHRIRRAA
jgi:hypothetical protein